MIERIVYMLIFGIALGLIQGYMYYTTIDPKIVKILEILKKGDNEEYVRK